MNDWIIEIDMPIDQPWYYRVSAERLKETLWAFGALGHRVNNVREAS